jgi:hypothetical protein
MGASMTLSTPATMNSTLAFEAFPIPRAYSRTVHLKWIFNVSIASFVICQTSFL